MTKEEHIQRHKELHKALDELVADWITHMQWFHSQTLNPTELP